MNENTRHAHSAERIVPSHGHYGGPLCCVIAKYEDGSQISFSPSVLGESQAHPTTVSERLLPQREHITCLIKAVALITAEIERLLRVKG